ncbi:hypothetical protein TNIN_465241 [Trichonephila inaurata madagascariensis]|uniref:Uncharacterized protein n=1 Tax=Trichonephila inaurata madagascariensis TaxID=2747483 RepID=A0A8X7CS08_9ARAC|nr:hypothetical protein TNIN_465241 [Trichonephila inaurata madagascariensis]
MFFKSLTKMSPLMSIKGHSDSLVHSLRSEHPGYSYLGYPSGSIGSCFLADCCREPLHTLPTSMPGRGGKLTRISWLKAVNYKNITQTVGNRIKRDPFLVFLLKGYPSYTSI